MTNGLSKRRLHCYNTCIKRDHLKENVTQEGAVILQYVEKVAKRLQIIFPRLLIRIYDKMYWPLH